MTDRVWLVLEPGPARFSDEHGLWCRTVDVFSSREDALRYLEDGVGTVRLLPKSKWQRFDVFEDERRNQWMVCMADVNPKMTRMFCQSGRHKYHRSSEAAAACRMRPT